LHNWGSLNKVQKKVQKKFKKSSKNNYSKIQIVGGAGREGGWRIVIPMPEALNCVEGVGCNSAIAITFKITKIYFPTEEIH
jgi:hypothetical protein